MLDNTLSQPEQVIDADVDTTQVRICNSCDQSLFHITHDNRILCSTCCKYVAGWHALGTTFAS